MNFTITEKAHNRAFSWYIGTPTKIITYRQLVSIDF